MLFWPEKNSTKNRGKFGKNCLHEIQEYWNKTWENSTPITLAYRLRIKAVLCHLFLKLKSGTCSVKLNLTVYFLAWWYLFGIFFYFSFFFHTVFGFYQTFHSNWEHAVLNRFTVPRILVFRFNSTHFCIYWVLFSAHFCFCVVSVLLLWTQEYVIWCQVGLYLLFVYFFQRLVTLHSSFMLPHFQNLTQACFLPKLHTPTLERVGKLLHSDELVFDSDHGWKQLFWVVKICFNGWSSHLKYFPKRRF
jgi:hypothetical protein